jgi:hypothetical protein
VSPEGLVATNHHCVHGAIQYNSKPGQDLIANGFLAKATADELPAAPGTRVYVIEELRDVTRPMLRGVSAGVTGGARQARLEANRKALIAACEEAANRRCDVRAYYGGSSYYLQRQLEIKDVRLVYAPAEGVGNFGGEVDNWQWPRHTGDFGFYRAYVAPDGSSAAYDAKNVPYRPKARLTVAQDGVKDGDFVMLAGFPGVTERYRTAAETKFFYEKFYPRQQQLLADYSDRIVALTAGDADAQIKYASILRGADNIKKKLTGQIAGAEAISLLEKKTQGEAAFTAWAEGRSSAQRAAKPAVAALDAVAAEQAEAQLTGLTTALLNRAQLLSAARDLYRFARERQKPDMAREAGFQERDRRFLAERLTQIERRFLPRVDRALFEAALADYRRLPAADRNAALEKTLAEIGLDTLYAETKLGDTATRLAWLDKSPAEFEASTDPFIRLAVAMAPEEMAAEAKRKDREGRLHAARSAQMTGLRAWAASQGRELYPDANGSLRFTFGKVAGRARDGMAWQPFTTGQGILEKTTGREPFATPATLTAALKADPAFAARPVNYLSTLDITNGNSGSATLNAKGEFVGLAFDGTIEGIISDWWFDEGLTRTIHVDSRYMLDVMKIDGATRLLEEMRGTAPAS